MMKKVSFTLFSVLMLFGTGAAFAEETQESTQNLESTETVVMKETNDNQEKVLVDETNKDIVEAVVPDLKEDVAKEIMFLDAYLQRGYITNDQYNEYVEKLNNAKTTEEIDKIVNELFSKSTDISSYRWAFGERYINLKINIQEYQKQGKLTKEQSDKFIQELEQAKTLEDIEKVSNDVRQIVGADEDTTAVTKEEKDNAKRYLEILIANSYITDGQFKELLAELDNVTTKSEFDRFYDNVAAVSTESEMFMWAFSESYINIRANISSSLKDGNITEEQANKLFNQVDAARTRAELDAVGKELDELLKGTRDSTTTPTKETTTSESKKSDGKGTLPKTGESNQTIFTLLGSFLVTGTAISYILFRKK